ncbi:hypothetical protein ACK6U7_23225, partial [Escherichia coli]
KTSIFSHPVYLFLREFSLQDFRGGSVREKTELASLYGLVQASTFDNEKNLPADYIPSLLG